MTKELITYLSQFISETRRGKFDTVLEYRTKHITIALEDLYQPHNASAVCALAIFLGYRTFISSKTKMPTL